MKPSTAAELAGFAALVVAAWLAAPIAGVVALGLALLFVGYALDDAKAALSVRKGLEPLRIRRQNRIVRKADRKARRRERRTIPRRQPAEVVVHIDR